MTYELPPIVLKGKELTKYRHLKRKYPVSKAFLHRNWWNVKRFIVYALSPRCVIRNYAWRRRRGHRVRIVRRVRILLFDPRIKRMIKRRLQNVRQWSKTLVSHYKKMGRIEEYEETEVYSVAEPLAAEELSKQMKQQLELLKTGKRSLSLIEDTNLSGEVPSKRPKKQSEVTHVTPNEDADDQQDSDFGPSKRAAERTPTKSPAQTAALEDAPTPATPSKEQSGQTSTCSSAEKPDKVEKAGGSKFLDMLISKVRVKNFAREDNMPSESFAAQSFVSEDEGSEDFVGFDESVHQPGMLLTPLVPINCKTQEGNSAFVSETLDAYMREHHINDDEKDDKDKLLEPMGHDGQVTSHSMPPMMDMPAVPEALQRLRTVAERRQYLQRCKNHKMGIINNEANIYRELQRKQRQRKVKVGAMQGLQAPSSQMPFTRQGWQAASYVATENSNYYYQVIQVDGEMVRLPGAQGNNLKREKSPYLSRLTNKEENELKCSGQCLDARICRELKVIPTKVGPPRNPKILNQFPLPAIFRPCPLSKKPFQRPLDDDTAALLLAGGSMAVVSMPNVQLDVMPQLGRPLDEIAKRYLQHILPHHDITREWAEFSVSTLQTPPSCMKDAEEQAAQTPAGRRKSFTFVIPYLNDRNHILVRRVVDRSEELDESFNEVPEKLQEFTFREELPSKPDVDILACADMINDMINTVAISCSENSFIREDPDTLNNSASQSKSSDLSPSKEETGKDAAKLGGKTKRLPNKQKRLASELRRLNATIIDAAARNADANKPCIKDHCQLGCLCASLAGTELPVRDHCGRAECVLNCRCLGAEKGRVMRVEAADGRGISNEDAFNLRRKATARLAKMEKDFTSTLVLTDNETLLINESQGDKKRRCTKAPKRYEDFDDTMFDEEEKDVVSPTSKKQKKIAAAAAAAATAAAVAAAAAAASAKIAAPALSEPCSVKDTDLAKLKHCFVGLRRLPDIDNLATFCMTHQLYKCFCGGDSPDGKPVVIEKEQWNAPVTHFNPELATRAHYSFERPPEEMPVKKKGKEKKPKVKLEQKAIEEDPKPNTFEEECSPSKTEPKEEPKVPPSLFNDESPLQRSIELDTIFSYFRSRPHICRRAISVPKNSYQRLNKRRAERVRQHSARQETPETIELLKTRMQGAITYYRKELDRQRKREQSKKSANAPVIEVRDDSDGSEVSSRKRSGKPAKATTSSKRMKLKSDTPSPPEEDNKLDIQVPRIAACYSLNSASVDVLGSGMANAAAAAAAVTGAAHSSAETDSPNFRSFYNEVVKNMNTLVSKKMQDIDLALQRESKIIPAPNEEILCIIKWTNFLAAFESGFVFIWDVQMKTHSFLAATTANLMPSVCGAIGVVNTMFAPDPQALPLMARMLMNSTRNENTNRLAVVMQGRKSFWLVKGFLRHMEGNACTKPTPTTHPLLTKKINVLCSLLVKQRIREHQKKLHSGGGSPSEVSDSPAADVAAPTSLLAKQRPREHQKRPKNEEAAVSTTSLESSSAGEFTSSVPLSSAVPASAVSSGTAGPSVGDANSLSPGTKSKSSASGIRSNIEFRKVNHCDVDELQIPELHKTDHRWVVLDIFDDFSHIFVPAFGDMISLTRIHKVMKVAEDTQKVVKLQFFPNAPYDAFVTPSSKKKIYFGPLSLDMPPPVLVLLQSVDRKMMLREVYQREHSIPVQRNRRSMALWVLHVNGQVHFEIDMESTAKLAAQQKDSTAISGLNVVKIPSQLSVEIEKNDETVSPVVIIDSDEEDDDADNQLVIDEQEDQQLVTEIKQEQLSRTNFTIQTLPTSGALQITTSDLVAPTTRPTKDVTTCQLTGGFMPFIANVPAKNGEMPPTTQYLTPQVQVTTSASVPETTSPSSSTNSPAAKFSRFSVAHNKINESLQELLSSGNTVTPGGITITKLESKDKKLPNEAVQIGSKRSVTGVAKQVSKAIPVPGTVFSVGHVIRPLANPNLKGIQPIRPAAAGTNAGVKLYPRPSIVASKRQSVPGNAKPAVPTTSRQSLPAKVTIASDKPSPVCATKLPVLAEPPVRVSLPVKPSTSGNQLSSRQSLPAKVAAKPVASARPEPVASAPQKAANAPANQQGNEDCCYGIMGAKGLPRFRVKVQGSVFMVKIPENGVQRFKTFGAAASFLNRHLSEKPKFKMHLPAQWKFLPLERSPIKQNSTSNVPSKNQQPPAAILIED
ncbi:uncharacterized protein LOC108041357 [Drosophila rhopaloa]|uniref:Uncharacterized protein LOC108041357 n=1 Tax=Drosophila rhopaloa TaxID=1041015 RepID=A0A6P4EID6_DRORH|nr:uncharacterized protein LOC108041357 [Drosophila rhopaloa]XP_016974754.1 uncharacterized protein LOC108041357 [Drosophila rhopaloa]XP_016974755.1 uncharacterized protein LOC108041357 [Drosophila rhopaloa]